MVDIKRKLAVWLYPHFREIDTRLAIAEKKVQYYENLDEKDLMRKTLGGLDMSISNNYLVGLSTEEIKELNRFGFELSTHKWWKHLVEWAINRQSAEVIGNILHSERKTLFGAGQIDGIMLLREVVEARKDAHVLDMQPDEAFDAHKAIQD